MIQKLNFSSSVLLTIASMLGAGIFVKTKSLNVLAHNNTAAIFFLIFFGVCIVISLLVPISLVISRQATNLGYLEWTEKYCPSWFNQLAINFTRFIYQPLSLLMVSTYIVEILKNEYQLSAWITVLCSMFFVFLFMLLNLFSFNFMAKLQMVLLIIVLISLFTLPIIGFIDLANGKVVKTNTTIVPKPATSLNGYGGWMVLLSGFPTIFFMYDGFYNTLSLRGKMKRPEKLSLCLVVSFILITFLYLFIIFSFKLGSSTGHYADIPTVKNHILLNGIFNLTVACSGFLTLNSSAMSNVKQLLAAHEEYEFKDIHYLKNKLFLRKKIPNKKFADEFTTWIYLMIKSLCWYFLIGLISQVVDWISKEKENILSINDAIADVTSSLIFLIIAVVIIHLTKVVKKDFSHKKLFLFKYAAYVSSSVIFLACFYSYLNNFVGMFGVNGANGFLCGFKLFTTLLFIFISAFPYVYQKYIEQKNKNWYTLLGVVGNKQQHFSLIRYKNK